MDPKKKRDLILGALALPVLIAVILGAAYGGRTLWGSPVGEKCEEDFGCTPHSICISQRCRRSCAADSECQPGWVCRGTEVSKTTRKRMELTTVNICFSPESMAPVRARELQANIEKKRSEVRLQVIVKMTTTPPQLTDAEFDAAWRTIPEQEQASAGVDALAGRVIALARPARQPR